MGSSLTHIYVNHYASTSKANKYLAAILGGDFDDNLKIEVDT
jgi:hypothetical protein